MRGVQPGGASGTTPFAFGDFADAEGTSLSGVSQVSQIGRIMLGALTSATGIQGNAILTHDSAIESFKLASIKIGALKAVNKFSTTPSYIDENGGVEDPIDTVIRIEV